MEEDGEGCGCWCCCCACWGWWGGRRKRGREWRCYSRLDAFECWRSKRGWAMCLFQDKADDVCRSTKAPKPNLVNRTSRCRHRDGTTRSIRIFFKSRVRVLLCLLRLQRRRQVCLSTCILWRWRRGLHLSWLMRWRYRCLCQAMGGMYSRGKKSKHDFNNLPRRVCRRIGRQFRPQPPQMIFRVRTVWKINNCKGKSRSNNKRKTRPSWRGDAQLKGVRRLFVVCSRFLLFSFFQTSTQVTMDCIRPQLTLPVFLFFSIFFLIPHFSSLFPSK